MPDMRQIAAENLENRIRSNPYPGRGLVIGLCDDGESFAQVYWIMGRSPNSRNRVFCADRGHVWTEAADPTEVEDPSLIIYNAMRELPGLYIVTNGDQTDTIFRSMIHGADFEQALATRLHEPDSPNFTPRISGLLDICSGAPIAKLSVVKASPFDSAESNRSYFHVDAFASGLGYTVTTYTGDGSPLPPFEGEPYLLPLPGDADAIADAIWEALDIDNKVSLAVKVIGAECDAESRVVLRNKYEQAG